MSKWLIFLGLFFMPPAISAELAELKKYHFSEAHLGTDVHLVFYSDRPEQAESLAQRCFQRVQALDAVLSDYQPYSELSQLCRKPIGKAHPVSKDLFAVIARAQQISRLSHGAFDITMGKASQSWRARSLSKPVPKDHADQVSEMVSFRDIGLVAEQRLVTLRKMMRLDLGGIGKGYIADQVMLVLKKADVTHAAVIIGGETLLADAPPGKTGWRIGIENPEHQLIGTLDLANTAVSTSGDSYQFFEVEGERESHLIDPTTKRSKTNRLNVVTIARSSMLADAWATALRVLPTSEARDLADQQPGIEALFIPYRQATSGTKHFPKLAVPEKN